MASILGPAENLARHALNASKALMTYGSAYAYCGVKMILQRAKPESNQAS
jgi:hypothetical protein